MKIFGQQRRRKTTKERAKNIWSAEEKELGENIWSRKIFGQRRRRKSRKIFGQQRKRRTENEKEENIIQKARLLRYRRVDGHRWKMLSKSNITKDPHLNIQTNPLSNSIKSYQLFYSRRNAKDRTQTIGWHFVSFSTFHVNALFLP